MKVYKGVKWFISLVITFAAVICLCCTGAVAADGKTVTATTATSVKQGYGANCFVYLDSTEGLASIDITVHFDPSKIKINNVYNSVDCVVYDSAITADSINISYILDGKGTASKTQMFYFYYQVLGTAELGDTSADITVGEAYDSTITQVPVSGSRCKFSIDETVTTKSCSVSSSSTVSTKVQGEFSLSYRFSTYQIASGSAVINYDPEIFEVTSVTEGAFLGGKIADINTDLAGAVYISFVGTQYNSKYDLVTINFKTIKNMGGTSKITFKATELCDLQLNPIACSGYSTNANIAFDSAYVGDAPKMQVSAIYDKTSGKVFATVKLDKNSKLGAGDFVLTFDNSALAFSSYEVGFDPDMFIVNDAQASNGVLKFYIVSTTDITSAETVVNLTFNVKSTFEGESTWMDINGSNLTDSLTNPIMLNFIGADDITLSDPIIAGDVNGDEIVDKDDAINLMMHIFFPDTYLVNQNVDFNNDKVVDKDDAIYLMMHIFFPDTYPIG